MNQKPLPKLACLRSVLFSLLLAANSTCHVHTEFECGNGDCIDFSRTCDGVAQCKDKSDEKQSYCSKVPVLPPLSLVTSLC